MKLSPTDRKPLDKWDDYTGAKEAMFFYTDTADAPWTIIKSNDKKRARLNCITHLLGQIPYEDLTGKPVKLGRRGAKGKYDDQSTMAERRWVPAVY